MIPRMTSTSCVTRSVNASTRFSALDSWIPITLTATRIAISTTVAPTWVLWSVASGANAGTYLPRKPR